MKRSTVTHFCCCFFRLALCIRKKSTFYRKNIYFKMCKMYTFFFNIFGSKNRTHTQQNSRLLFSSINLAHFE